MKRIQLKYQQVQNVYMKESGSVLTQFKDSLMTPSIFNQVNNQAFEYDVNQYTKLVNILYN